MKFECRNNQSPFPQWLQLYIKTNKLHQYIEKNLKNYQTAKKWKVLNLNSQKNINLRNKKNFNHKWSFSHFLFDCITLYWQSAINSVTISSCGILSAISFLDEKYIYIRNQRK